MKQIKMLATLLCVLVALASCHKTDYVQVIPQDASFVVSANIADMAEEADLRNSSLMQTVNNYMGLITSGDARQQFQHYIDDPASMGIDFTRPLYFFIAGDFAGLTMCVADDGDVEDFVQMLTNQNLCRGASETDGVKTALLLDDIVLSYDSHTLLLLANTEKGSVAQARQVAAQLMKQDKELSFMATEAYGKMDDRDDCDVVAYGNGAAFSGELLEQVRSFIPTGIRPVDIELISSLSFEKGRAVLSANVEGKSNTAQKLIEEGNDNFHKIEGRYIGLPQEDFALWACMGVKGSPFLERLKQESNSKQFLLMLERAIDIEQIIRTIDGDVAIAIPKETLANKDFKKADFMLMAKVDNTDFLDDVDYWQKTMKDYGATMTKTKSNDYILKASDYTLNWGVDEEDVYFASPRMFASYVTSQRSKVLESMESEIKKNQVFIYCNLETIVGNVRTGRSVIDNMAGKLKALIIKSKSSNSIELSVELKSDDENFLKALL